MNENTSLPETPRLDLRKKVVLTVFISAIVICLTEWLVLPIKYEYADDVPFVNLNDLVPLLDLLVGLASLVGIVYELLDFCIARHRPRFLFHYCLAFAMTAMALASSITQPSGRMKTKQNACINNLRQIDGAKQQWALESNQSSNAIPAFAEIASYLGRGAASTIPTCPSKGIYKLKAVVLAPTCSIAGHELE